MPGPVRLQLSNKVYLEAKELKVVHHGEPLLLIGTDVLSRRDVDFKFCYIGLQEDNC